MTDHITIPRTLLVQAMNALLLPCDRWNGQQFKIVTAAAEAIRAELAKPVEQAETITTDIAVKRLCKELRDDLDYAWSWHCNVAMTAYDAGCPHDVANEGAARFMQLLAGVDTREHFAFSGTRTKVTSPTPAWHDAPTCDGLWLCNDGDDNPYRRTTHRVTFPLNQLLVGENERWYGPIPQDKEGGAA